MLLVSSHRGQLQTSRDAEIPSRKSDGFATGLAAIDGLLGGGMFVRGAVHELLAEPGGGMPMFFAAMLARCVGMRGNRWQGEGETDRWGDDRWGDGTMGRWDEGATHPIIPSSRLTIESTRGVVVWSDPQGQLYPPAVAAAGIPLERLLILRPRDEGEGLWAAAECMRCRGVAATVVNPRRLSRLEARRLQLAAEGGGGIGILLRTIGRDSREYAAATRWVVGPAPGERMVQRWKLELIHGHGGRIGQCVILEVCRETNHVRAFEAVGGGLVQEAAA